MAKEKVEKKEAKKEDVLKIDPERAINNLSDKVKHKGAVQAKS